MSKPKFYQAELRLLTDEQVMDITRGQAIEERMEDENATCPECGGNEWWLLPKDSAPVKMGMKPYCECLKCGFQTHL